jgi:hypothetical protein
MTRDVTILYQGGSGGFALFYYLLLSGKYHTGIDYNSVQELVDEQFSDSLIDRPHTWKHKEFWPDNQKCKLTKPGPRLFLICNPLWSDSMMQQNLNTSTGTHKILLYTSFKLQLRMAWEKQAYWFTNVSKTAFRAPPDTKQYLRQIIQTQMNGLDPQVERIEKMFRPAQKVELVEFMQSRVLPGFDNPNAAQLEFLDRWLALQPKKAQCALSSGLYQR